MLAYNIHHTALVVRDIDSAIADYESHFKVTPISRAINRETGATEAVIAIGGSHIKLIEPLSQETPIGQFLSQRGEGVHHIAFAVHDIERALTHLRETGAELIDETPRTNSSGDRVALVRPHKDSETLIELVEVNRKVEAYDA